LMGYMEGVKPTSSSNPKTSKNTREIEVAPSVSSGGGLEGQFGHLAP